MSGNMVVNESGIPLVVDLDGTLSRADLLYEIAILFFRQRPLLAVFLLAAWLLKGKSYLKTRLAQSIEMDVSVLPYREEVLALIQAEKSKGRKIVLATATHQLIAAKIAEHLGIFDLVLATEEHVNLSAERKEKVLIDLYGSGNFDYIGNSTDDFKVWRSCRHALVVSRSRRFIARVREIADVTAVYSAGKVTLKQLLQALRVHQWMKNSLLFVPLLASHQLFNPELLLQGLVAFISFSFCASSVYVLNDLLDLQDDRHHAYKRNRAFASAALDVAWGVVLFPLFLIFSIALGYVCLNSAFLAVIGVYYVLTVFYTFFLKRIVIIDVIVLALLYTVRIVAGAFVFELELTFWLLAFSMFIFLSLALIKRYAELNTAKELGRETKTRGRGYYPSDLEMVSSLGAAAGYISVMVLALYIQESATRALYTNPQIIWLACPVLLFWVSRTWLLTHRGEMHDDPLVFAITDKTSLVTGLVFCLIFWLAAQ